MKKIINFVLDVFIFFYMGLLDVIVYVLVAPLKELKNRLNPKQPPSLEKPNGKTE